MTAIANLLVQPDWVLKFWSKVSLGAGCWDWQAGKTTAGYGEFRVPGEGQQYTHRLSYRYFKGIIPGKLHVLHTCDRPCCIRPEHLFLGTHQDNMADKVAKGRQHSGPLGHNGPGLGEKNHQAKITDAEVQAMRLRFRPNQHHEAAQAYNMSPQNAARILTRKTWRHVP